MAGKEDYRIFVGGLSWEVTERQLENAFNRYGKITECQNCILHGREQIQGRLSNTDLGAL